MNASVKIVVWELLVILSFCGCVLSETFLFFGIVPILTSKQEEISLICIVVACCIEMLSLILCMISICVHNRKKYLLLIQIVVV